MLGHGSSGVVQLKEGKFPEGKLSWTTMATFSYRSGIFIAASLLLQAILSSGVGQAQTPSFYRIGTGETSDSVFVMGAVLAGALSNPPGAPTCEQGGNCGVPGLVVVTQSSAGSMANAKAVAEGRIDAGLVQADVAARAYQGRGMRAPLRDLRTVTEFYIAKVHVVVRADSRITKIADLAGKRIAVGEAESGSDMAADALIEAYRLPVNRIKRFNVRRVKAVEMLAKNEVDALITVENEPAPAITELAGKLPIRLLPIQGKEAEAWATRHITYMPQRIEKGTYPGIDDVPTLGVGILWVVHANAPPALVESLTAAFWNAKTQATLQMGRAKMTFATLETVTYRVTAPLHPGAAKFYRNRGLAVTPAPD